MSKNGTLLLICMVGPEDTDRRTGAARGDKAVPAKRLEATGSAETKANILRWGLVGCGGRKLVRKEMLRKYRGGRATGEGHEVFILAAGAWNKSLVSWLRYLRQEVWGGCVVRSKQAAQSESA